MYHLSKYKPARSEAQLMQINYTKTSYLELVWDSKSTRNNLTLVRPTTTIITPKQVVLVVKNTPVGRVFVKFIYLV